jgi:hypothetical protein
MDQTALDMPAAAKATVKPRVGLFASQWTVYSCIILLAALGGYVYWLKNRSIFACQAPGYSADRYLAYCNGGNYADFEHGAFFYNLEPPALDYARNADVLVLGNSRLQVALSNEQTADWFKQADIRPYLLAFSYNEDMVFTEKLLQAMNPRASVYIINVDDFFERRETAAAKTILNDPDARNRYEWKRFSQRLHQPICGAFPKLCGDRFVIFRSRETGAYYRIPMNERRLPQNEASYDTTADEAVVKNSTALAINFLKEYAKGRCVILTNVPYPQTKMGNAEAIAAATGFPLITPKVDGLYTTDGYHLDRDSAERWSKAFLEAAGPEIRSCVEKQKAARS